MLEEIAAAEQVAKARDEEAAVRKRAELEAEEKKKAAEAERRREEAAAAKAKEEVCMLPLMLAICGGQDGVPRCLKDAVTHARLIGLRMGWMQEERLRVLAEKERKEEEAEAKRKKAEEERKRRQEEEVLQEVQRVREANLCWVCLGGVGGGGWRGFEER